MQGIILFQSKYGATRKYAQWLAAATGFALKETKKATLGDVHACEVVVLAGGIYASGIAGLSFLKKHMGELGGRRVAVLCVGASPVDKAAFDAVAAHNLTGALVGLPCFYARGAWRASAMTLVDRTLCGLLKKAVAKKAPEACEPWERALMEAGDGDCDWTDRAYLAPLIDWIGQAK